MKSGRGVKHYHAHTGMPGYLPNQTAAFGTLEEARAWAAEEARRWRDELPDGVRLVGNRVRGYWYEVDDAIASSTAWAEEIWVPSARDACHCDEVWLCQNGTMVDESGPCWCCGERPPARD